MSKFRMPYTRTDTAIVLVIDGKPKTVNKGDDRYLEVEHAIRDERFEDVMQILDIKGRLISDSDGELYLKNGVLYSEKYEIPTLLADRIVTMYKEGFNIKPLTRFLENLMENPNESGTIVEEIYGFIEACNLPLTPDGEFLAYKMVSKNFTDLYTGTMDNSVGAVPEMKREDCDFNRDRTCSRGLHFCSENYLGEYGTRKSSQVVIVKVNPRDVTSIPTDYDNAKGRACKYEIVDAISWDDLIKPWFSDEYSDVPDAPEEDLFEEEGWFDEELDEDVQRELDVYDGVVEEDKPRWEVREFDTDALVDAFDTRKQARNFRNSFFPDQQDYFVWDAKYQKMSGGVRFNTGAMVPDVPDVPDASDEPHVNGTAKLNESVVRQILKVLRDEAYDTLQSLGQMFNVSERTIRRIRDGESWTHVKL